MSIAGAADEWDFAVPGDDGELLAEFRRHGVTPGRRVRVALVADTPKRRSARGFWPPRWPPAEVLTQDDFDAAHQADMEAAAAKYGSVGV